MRVIKFLPVFFIATLFLFGANFFSEKANSQIVHKEVENFASEYFPGDTVDVKIVVPGADNRVRNAADTMLVMDRSDSMDDSFGALGATKLDAAKNALSTFVDQTAEDTGPDGPGDFLGLASYSYVPNMDLVDFQCPGAYLTPPPLAELNFPIANMTGANKTLIKNQINSLVGCGGTPLGHGLRLAFQELTNQVQPSSTSRNGVNKYIVAATDGIHNRGISPYDPSVMAQIIANNIPVFTIGIGNDVQYYKEISEFPAGSYTGYIDPNGDGDVSGEELMKRISCDSDIDCVKTWNTTNPCDVNHTGNVVGAVNDLDCPDHYFFANNPALLTQIYQQIANEIIAPASYGIIDGINTNIFSGIVPGSLTSNTITNCATGAVWPSRDLSIRPTGFVVNLDPIPNNVEVCVRFKVVIREDVPPALLNTPVTVNTIGFAAAIDPDFSCGNIQIINCVIQMGQYPLIDIANTSILIVDPFDPWLKTEGGILGSKGGPAVGSISNIERNPSDAPLPIPSLNNNFLTIADSGIDNNFESLWEIENYGGIELHIDNYNNVPGSIYSTLLNNYRRKCSGGIPTTATSLNDPLNISSALTAGCNIVVFSGNEHISSSTWSYSGKPAVVFVEKDLTVSKDISIGSNTGIIFIVGEDIVFETKDNAGGVSGADNIDGVYIAQGKIYSSKSGETDEPSGTGSDDPLLVHGALYSFDEFLLTRSLADNEDTPSEQVTFDPKYLFLFANILGDVQSVYKEVAP